MLKSRLSSILTTSCFAVCGWFFVQIEAANAFTVVYNDNQPNGNGYRYSYLVNLESPDESLAVGDTLRFSNLYGVTGADDQNSPYEFSISLSNSQQVVFEVTSDTSGPGNFEVFIDSTTAIGSEPLVDYIADYQLSTESGDFSLSSTSDDNGRIYGPTVAQAVPFEFSPSTGLLSLLVLFGFKRGWKFLMGKEKPAI